MSIWLTLPLELFLASQETAWSRLLVLRFPRFLLTREGKGSYFTHYSSFSLGLLETKRYKPF